jgi:hypothetical protein
MEWAMAMAMAVSVQREQACEATRIMGLWT